MPIDRGQFSAEEAAVLEPYFTNLNRPVFALRNLPEVVKGALFSRYSRTEKSLRRVLLEEFINELDPAANANQTTSGDRVAAERAEAFYERILVGYGDDSVAELAGAHIAIEGVSTLAAKALEDARIGISPLEKSTRYVRFDRPGADGLSLYYRGAELRDPAYQPAMEDLFATYRTLLEPLTEAIRQRFPRLPEESERAWRSATRAKALDLLRGLLPASTLSNLGLFGNGRAFEYLILKMAAQPLPEFRLLAHSMHAELSLVIPAFVRRALDKDHGEPAIENLKTRREATAAFAPTGSNLPTGPEVKLIEFDPDAESKVVAASLFPYSNLPLDELRERLPDHEAVLSAVLGGRQNRRQRPPRALEHAAYTFEITANFAAYRDLQRHRMLTQDRQLIGTDLGYDVSPQLIQFGMADQFIRSLEGAARAHRSIAASLGAEIAQYAVPLAFRMRWYMRVNLREIYHLCELRTTVQGHPDYRYLAQEIYRRVQEVHPRLIAYADFVDLGPGDELERRRSEQRLDSKMARFESQS